LVHNLRRLPRKNIQESCQQLALHPLDTSFIHLVLPNTQIPSGPDITRPIHAMDIQLEKEVVQLRLSDSVITLKS